MNRFYIICRSLLVLGIVLSAAVVFSQEPQQSYEPRVGQPGKDVVWVPTAQQLVDMMLDMAKITPQDYVIDLGSGDGRTVITAAKRGTPAMGIEYNPDMIELSRKNAAEAGVGDKATFIQADLFETDFSKATVVTMFLLPSINIRLRPKLLDMKPGTRIVSNTFHMESWQADDSVRIEEGCTSYCKAYLWIIPAKVEGKWKTPQGELTLKQEFQMITGTLNSSGSSKQVEGKLTGDQIVFKAGNAEYTGRVNGNTITGTMKRDTNSENWEATQVKP
jgi:precorrin-6B methylase 2